MIVIFELGKKTYKAANELQKPGIEGTINKRLLVKYESRYEDYNENAEGLKEGIEGNSQGIR